MPKNSPIDIKEFTHDELLNFLVKHGFARYASAQIFDWIYHKRVEDFLRMSNISKALRAFLAEEFYFSRITLKSKKTSKDNTIKFLFELDDLSLIETVFIPEAKRNTLCISTQVGCKFRCTFCSSGLEGFKRNLSCSEIVNQFLFVQDFLRSQKITNIVFMGVGEPLDNFDNLIKAARIFLDHKGIYLGKRKICVSTAGVAPAIKKLADLKLGLRLSVSLHSADDRIRSRCMPINRMYNLDSLMKALRYFVRIHKFGVTFEYILIKGLNSSPEDARKLADLVKNIECKINLIPYNASPQFSWQPPTKEEIDLFTRVLKDRGLFFTLRKSRGRDIEAACGQLRSAWSRSP
jgi:23S rRNA (adenine2503-C2)-methyltransferase